ncbi:MAG: ATP phosphoribosyltransferase regulatory subunit [Methylobacteriaceae bacterium]|nr:ATP phosphoribosyltransferase regulatory subunit [Methylobacteriaceae bacterium]
MSETEAGEPGGLAGQVTATLVAAGYPRVEPPVLQPAQVFLDQSGEDIRGRLYLTSDASGAEFCLRPEYTIPVCRAYLASPQAGAEAAFSYAGPVFRVRPGQSGEFAQAGLESFGRPDAEAADAEILALALEAAAAAGLAEPQVLIGDAGLVAAFLEALALPPVWLRRLRRGLMRGRSLAEIFAPAANGREHDHSGVLAALEGVDRQGARALVEDLLSIAGIAAVGGRTAGEIAERFLEQSATRSGPPVGAEQRAALDRFFAVRGDPDQASADLRGLADDAGLDIAAALDSLDARTGFLAARGVDVGRLDFAAAFHRNLDYYTGFVFEARDPRRADGKPVIGGGRYDRLLRTLGAKADIPAVGAAIWLDRLGGAA